MTNEIETLIKKSALRDVKIMLLNKKLEGMIIPDVVFEVLNNVEDSYNQELPPEVINEIIEHGND